MVNGTHDGVRVDYGIAVLLLWVPITMSANTAQALGVEIPTVIQAEVKELGCNSCNGWNQTESGPAWQEVADRYHGQTDYVCKEYVVDSTGKKSECSTDSSQALMSPPAIILEGA